MVLRLARSLPVRFCIVILLCFSVAPIAGAQPMGAAGGSFGATPQPSDQAREALAQRTAQEKAERIERMASREGKVLGLEADARYSEPYVQGEVLVRFRPGITATAQSAMHASVGATLERSIKGLPGLDLVHVKSGTSVVDAIAKYSAMPGIAYAEPNFLKETYATPNDPKYSSGELWGLRNTGQDGGTDDADIDAGEAWNLNTGSSDVIVGVIDSGVDWNHPDLAANMWHNPGETPGNGVDDDDNGYVDDYYGYDFTDQDSDPNGGNPHGTHVAGTIGGVGNNGVGVTGVNWDVSIAALRVGVGLGTGISTAAVVEAVCYARDMEFPVVNCSFGGTQLSQAEFDAFETYDGLVCAAAGNSGEDNDDVPHYPSSFDLDNIIGVGASDRNDMPTDFSCYGATSVDVFAPGNEIWSCVIGEPGGGEAWEPYFEDDFSTLDNWIDGSVRDPDHPTLGDMPWTLSSSIYYTPPTSAYYKWDIPDWFVFQSGWLETNGSVDLSGAEMARINYNTAYWLDDGSGFSNYGSLEAWAPGLSEPWTIDFFMDRSGNNNGDWESRYVDSNADLGYFIGEPEVHLIWIFEQFATVTGWGEWVVDDFSLETGVSRPDDSVAYDSWPGTSMATPHVAGIAALMLAEKPGLSAAQMKDIIMDTVDVPGTLDGKCVTEGRVNAAEAVEKAGATIPEPPDDGGGGGGDWGENGLMIVAGPDRYGTAIEASKMSYSDGEADTVVVATGENWPDALGGSALAGAVGGPLLLTRTAALPPAVSQEITRLGATKAYVLGGDGAIGPAVLSSLKSQLGAANVVQLEGPTRYETAQKVAAEVVRLTGSNFNGLALVARGDNYPDALAGSPISAAFEAPIVLARPGAAAPTLPTGTTDVAILGGPDVVSSAVENTYKGSLGSDHVVRLGGATRYETADLVAKYGVALGLSWNGAGIATGQNFPDALAGGALLARWGGVMLLTPTDSLHPVAKTTLQQNKTEVQSNFFIIGGAGAISDTVINQVKSATGVQ